VSLQRQVEQNIQSALKASDTRRVSALRLLHAQLTNERLSQRVLELPDADVLRVIQSEVRKRREAAESFHAVGRTEAARNEEAERAILEAYLPAQLSEADIERVVREVIGSPAGPARGPASGRGGGAGGAPAVGAVMGAVMAKLRGQADGTRVRAIVERVLAS
jgi:uncharacterized protein YqeY